METVRVGDFGKAALNLDRQPSILAPGEWSYLENMDVESGDLRCSRGDGEVAECPVEPKYSYVYEGATDTYLVISDGNEIHATKDGNQWVDISPHSTGFQFRLGDYWYLNIDTWANAADPTTWDDVYTDPETAPFGGRVTFTTFLGILIICPSAGTPLYWPDTDGPTLTLPNWPANWYADELIAFTNVLVAIGLDNTVAGQKYRVGWSDFAVEGSVPSTWSPGAGNSAGSVLLQDTEGYLVTARVLRDNLIIYKNDCIYRMYPRPDNQVFGFERVVSDHGCDSPDGVCNLGNAHFFADRGDLRIFDGQSTRSVAIDKIRTKLQLAISNDYRDKTIVVPHTERDEVWVGLVEAGATTVNAVLIYHTAYNAWTPRSYPPILSMTVGPMPALSLQPGTGDAWADHDEPWSDYVDSWSGSTFTATEDAVIMCGSSLQVWREDNTTTYADGSAKRCVAERTGMLLNGATQRVTMKRVYPEIEGSGSVAIQIGWQWEPNGSVNWTVPTTFTIGADRKVRARVTGIPVGLRVSSENPSSRWTLGAVTFEWQKAGRR